MVIPYTQGLGESIKKICRKYGIQAHFKGNRTIKNILVKPKDKDPLDRKSVAIYWYLTFGKRYKEYLKEPSPIYGHSNHSGHSNNPDNLTIKGREDHGLARTIKESIYIRVNIPTPYRNVGKYSLHCIWDRILFNTPGLKISNDTGHVHRTSLSGHVQSIPTKRHVYRTIGHTGHAQTSEYAHRTS